MALGNKYDNYEKSLLILNLETLEQRRWNLSLKFAQQSIKNKTMEEYFQLKISQNNLRNTEKYEVFHANTERKRKSPIIQMQHQLNKT